MPSADWAGRWACTCCWPVNGSTRQAARAGDPLSYRICLKTFSASESRAVLGVPDAYHLPSAPGAAYLKTASGELVRFQTAFVSGPHHEPPRRRIGDSVRSEMPMLFTAAPVGQITEHESRAANRSSTPTRTVFHTVVDRVADRGTPAHRVWLPPLTGSPTLDMLIPRDDPNPSLAVPIGLVDCPYEQRRELFVAELGAATGNIAVVGAPRSGKSTALRTLVMALATTHSPADVQFYCLDFGGGSLSSLRPLPHVGSVAGRLDVDLCRRTVAVMESLMRTREAKFRRLGIDSVADYRRPPSTVSPTILSATCSSSSMDGRRFARSSTASRAQSPRLPLKAFLSVFTSRWRLHGGRRCGRPSRTR